MHQARFEKLRELLTQQAIEALVLIPSPSLYYLTDLSFHLMERPVIGIFPRDSTPVLFLPELELQKVASSPLELKPITYGEDPTQQPNALQRALAEAGLLSPATIAVEPLSFRFFEMELLQSVAAEAAIVSAEPITASLRATKDQAEVEAMSQAVRIAETALEAALGQLKLGMTEQELQAELIIQLLRQGSQGDLPFQPIVASGPNSALPHAGAGQRKLGPKEFLLIDWGARFQGYCSDLTRTFALSEADEQMAAIYEAVRQANQAGRQAAKPGIAAGKLDKSARDRIEAAGYGQYFIHRLGHGLGLEAHEPPYIYAENSNSLEIGNAFTVEPGVYLPSLGGVRIEDNVVITEQGAHSLSEYPRELRVIG